MKKMIMRLLTVGLVAIMISATNVYAANQEEMPDSEKGANGTEKELTEKETEKSPDKEKEEPAKEDENSAQTINKNDCTPVQGLDEPYEITEPVISFRGIGTWIQSANGRWWYLHYDGGYTINGWEGIDGYWYYFDADGWMVTGWLNTGSWYYLNSSGIMLTGWQIVDGSWYYFETNGAMQSGWVNTGSWYYLRFNGTMVTDWQKIDGNWYYFGTNGAMQSGWVNDGSWYYLRFDGTMVMGWQKIDGNWYYFGTNGAMQSGWVNDGSWYYLRFDGTMVMGWQKIDGNWYYFNDSGVMNYDNMTDELYGDPRVSYFDRSGVWLYTSSLCSFDLVDSGKHLDWDGSTKYTSYVNTAAERWNTYKSGIIRKDSLTTIQDVKIDDYYEKDGTWGITYPNGAIDLNTYNMDGATYNQKLNTVMHEIGHALGLGHNDPADVMATYSEVVNLTNNDEGSYDAAYDRY